MDSQPFGDTNGFAQSEPNFATYVFSISTYLLNSQLARDLQALRGYRFRGQKSVGSTDIEYENSDFTFNSETNLYEFYCESAQALNSNLIDYETVRINSCVPNDSYVDWVTLEARFDIETGKIIVTGTSRSADISSVKVTYSYFAPKLASNFSESRKAKVKIEFTNGFNNEPANGEQIDEQDPVMGDDFYMFYKIVDSGINQEIAGIPALTVTFAR